MRLVPSGFSEGKKVICLDVTWSGLELHIMPQNAAVKSGRALQAIKVPVPKPPSP